MQPIPRTLSDAAVRRPTLREAVGALVVYAGTVTVLLGVVWLALGTEWGNELHFLNAVVGVEELFLFAVAAGLLLASPWLSWRQQGASAAVVLGVALFFIGVYGGGMRCSGVGYLGPTEWMFTYDVGENVLRYGHSPVGRDRIQCGGSPDRPQALLGTVVVTAGLLGVIAPDESTD